MNGSGEDLFRRTSLHDPALIHEYNRISHLAREAHFMRHDD